MGRQIKISVSCPQPCCPRDLACSISCASLCIPILTLRFYSFLTCKAMSLRAYIFILVLLSTAPMVKRLCNMKRGEPLMQSFQIKKQMTEGHRYIGGFKPVFPCCVWNMALCSRACTTITCTVVSVLQVVTEEYKLMLPLGLLHAHKSLPRHEYKLFS